MPFHFSPSSSFRLSAVALTCHFSNFRGLWLPLLLWYDGEFRGRLEAWAGLDFILKAWFFTSVSQPICLLTYSGSESRPLTPLDQPTGSLLSTPKCAKGGEKRKYSAVYSRRTSTGLGSDACQCVKPCVCVRVCVCVVFCLNVSAPVFWP